jgi:predicted ATPase/DNA-binding SARP family transcriptional activator
MLQTPWQINLFGGFAMKQRSRESAAHVTNQMALLLAMLAERIGRPQTRAELIEQLWPGVEEGAGRNRFRVLLAELRRVLEPPGTPSGSVLNCDRTTAQLAPTACRVDADDFQRHIQRASLAGSAEDRADHYKSADELYAGEFLAGFEGGWVQSRRIHYARLQSLCQFRYSAILEESGDQAGAMLQIARSIEADPLREAPRRRALRMLVESGDVGSALSEYEEYRRLLKRSVGLAPTSQLQEWIRSLRSWADSRRISQGEAVKPPKPAAPSTEAEGEKVFLPPALTSFVGRSADLSELSDLLPLYRWITLTGHGGIGKTRLAVETARANLSLFSNAVIYVPCGESAASSSLLETILRQVHIDSAQAPLETLSQYLSQPVEGGRNACLIILDGIDELPGDSNQVIQRLLTETPNTTVLATARRRRGATGEQEFAVGPIAVPDTHMRPDNLMVNASVQLFCERAQAGSARFAPTKSNLEDVAALCRRLEGVPLAIELAAAQASKMSPAEILAKISDLGSLKDTKNWRVPRQRSLQASLAFSFDALGEAEKRMFCALCVFQGSFDLTGATIVAGASPKDIERLVEHSLFEKSSADSRRYTMLNMVRDYGWSKLKPVERTNIQEKHAAYFLQLISDAEALHFNSGLQELSKLSQECENIRAAADWSIRKGDAEASIKFVAAMSAGWNQAGFQSEVHELARRARNSCHLSKLQMARLNVSEGLTACFHDDAATARELILPSLPLLEEAGMRQRAAGLRWVLGYVAYLSGDYEQALDYASRPETDLGEYQPRIETYRRHLVGLANMELGQLHLARNELESVLSNWLELGDIGITDLTRLSLARISWKQGALAKAESEYLELISTFQDSGDTRGLSYAIEGLGRVAVDLHNYPRATRLLGVAQRLRESLGSQRDFADHHAFEEAVRICRQKLAADFEADWQAGHGVPPQRSASFARDQFAQQAS